MGSVGVYVYNKWHKKAVKSTPRRKDNANPDPKSSMFIQYRTIDSIVSLYACVHLCVCSKVRGGGARVRLRKNTGLTPGIGVKIYSAKNSVRMWQLSNREEWGAHSCVLETKKQSIFTADRACTLLAEHKYNLKFKEEKRKTVTTFSKQLFLYLVNRCNVLGTRELECERTHKANVPPHHFCFRLTKTHV